MSFAHRLLHRLIALVAIAVPLGVFAPAAQALPEDFGLPKFKYSEFYIPPSPLPAGKPGDILKAEKMDFSRAITKPPRGTEGWRVMYLSTSATGQPIAVTGTVLMRPNQAPKQGIENRPIVSYGNEAQGLGDNCAVSRLLWYGHTGEIALWADLIRAGYAVASTDYEGLGTPDVHTFGVAVSEGHAMLDIVRAARNLEAAKLPKNGPVGLFGYSQGGAAAGFAAEQAATYAPDVKITAASFGGAPVDPMSVAKAANGQFFSALMFGAAVGFDAAYPELDLDSFLNDKGAALKKKIYGSCIEMIFPMAFKKVEGYLKPGMNPLYDARWQKRFAENKLGQVAPQFPVNYYHATWDEAAPYRDAKTLRKQYCAGGTPLRFVEVIGLEHVSTGPVWMPQAAKWLAARFEGKVDKGNCGKNNIFGLPSDK
ncbi:MAG: alpha/beta fold hydrolase [Solirubrobacteraceae bacterium]|nr:alpha/beta fold hydrolase [Solirubrobacteraceae bacterium]